MRLRDLEKWGIPSRMVELWKDRQGELLLGVQSRAVRRGLLGEPGSGCDHQPVRMIISAPTSSGKSFCAEMAAVRALMARRKVIMLSPLKSLAEQNYERLQDTFGRLAVKCLIVTGDHPENDMRFADGDYQVAVAIYEKLDLLLTSSLDMLKGIGLVVVDELQTVAEPGRGAVLERLLTKVLASVYEPSLVGLSAVIGDEAESSGRLAVWLDAILVEESTRPVDLIRGVAAEGSFRYRSFNSGCDGCEPFSEADAGDEPFENFIRQLKAEGGSTLVFLKSRMNTVEAAFKLAASVNWPEAKTALEMLAEEEPSFLVRSLGRALSRGVAFHNSDLSPGQRAIVEQAFVDGEARVIFSTTTLAMGVHLPADTVYLETVRYASSEYGDGPVLVPVSRAEFDNMTGRAGRLGLRDSSKPGRAVILADSEFDRDILWENYIAVERPEPIRSVLDSMPREDWSLDMIVCGLTDSAAQLTTLFARTLYAQLEKGTGEAGFDRVVRRLAADGLIEISGSGRLTITAFGRAVARSGLSVAQARHYRECLRRDHPETQLGWTALALSAPGWVLPPGILSHFEQVNSVPVKMLYRQFDHAINDIRFLLGTANLREPLSYRAAAALKSLFLLDRWRRLAPVNRLEEQFQVHLGQVMALGDTTAHLVSGLAALLEASERDSPSAGELREQAFSIRFGLPVSLRGLYAYLGRLLSRADYAALQKAGVENQRDLVRLSDRQLQEIIRGAHKRKRVNKILELLKEEIDMDVTTTTADVTVPHTLIAIDDEPELVEVDGDLERERFLIRVNGFPIRLTGKSFKYFARLAWSRLRGETGWVYKEDIEIGFNQARYLYRMKSEISSGLNSSWSVVENNRLGYYRLKVDPSRIRLNCENLRRHPDHEVRSLVLDETSPSVN